MRDHAVLCVDDEKDNLDMLSRLLDKKYKVFTALSAENALDTLETEKNISLIISDQKMPDMTGVELLKKSIQTHPDTVRILLTGYSEMDAIIQAVNEGHIYHYVNKPWEPPELDNIIKKSLIQFELKQELKAQNAKLKKALSEVKTLDKLKTDFMMLINHELKTPITNILNFCKLLETSNVDNDRMSYIAHIEEAGWQLNKLTDETLLFIKAEAGFLKLEKTIFSTQQVLSEALELLANDIADRGQKFEKDVDDIKVEADRKLFTNILKHLIHNSIKFSPENSPIGISIKQNKNKISFTVSNTGPAIPEDVLEKIMSPFTLFENSLNHSRGFGLGLSLCQALLKAHGTKLILKSTDKITTAQFDL